MLLPDMVQHVLTKPRSMRKRRVRLDHDIALQQPRRDFRAVEPRVQLVLADIDLAAAAGLDVGF